MKNKVQYSIEFIIFTTYSIYMRPFLTLILFCLSILVSGQDYQLFSINSKKVYQTISDSVLSYSLVFDSVVVNSNSTILYPNRDINFYPLEPGSYCSNWGFCYERNAPIWIGPSVEEIADGIYNFANSEMEILNFNFTIEPYAFHIFYEDDVQRFSYQYNPTIQTYTFDGIVDSVKVYEINHTDLNGNAIMSELQGFEIIVGKELGLINFFVVNDFPVTLVPLTLLGTNSPEAGLTKITYADIYDYNPGDEIQYLEYSFWNGGPPELNFHRYRKETYLERNETDEYLTYKVANEIFHSDSLQVSIDTIDLSYEKSRLIAEIPFDFANNEVKVSTSLQMVNHFGVDYWLYSDHNYSYELLYCEESNLWCDTEFNYEYSYNQYELGLGLYMQGWRQFYDRGNGKEVVYYKKDGVKYGKEVIVKASDFSLESDRLKIIPNPAKDHFRIEGDFTDGSILLIDKLSGGQVIRVNDYSSDQVINTDELPSGVYILRLVDSSTVYSGKLVVQ